MQIKRFFAGAALGALVLLPTAQGAFAACTNAIASGAKWNLFVAEMNPGANSSGNAISCDMSFGTGGAFTSTCKAYNTGSNMIDSATPTGTITMGTGAAACDFTGTINIPGNPSVIIQDGHINGMIASGVATQGTGVHKQVILFTMVRK